MRHLIAVALVGVVVLEPVAAHATAAQRPTMPLHGTAYDSLHRAPLRGAFVALAGTGRAATTDAHGRFTIDSVLPGTYTIALQHALFDSIGLSGVVQKISVRDSDAQVMLSVPSFESIWRRACGASRAAGDSGIVHGIVRNARSAAPVSHAKVSLSWIDLVVDKSRSVKQRRWTQQTTTDDGGSYAICGVPPGLAITVQAATLGMASGFIDMLPEDLRIRRRDLSISSTDPLDLGNKGAVTGTLTRSSGERIPGAHVRIADAGETDTDEEGRFALHGVPSGTRQIEVTVIGSAPLSEAVEVPAKDSAIVDLHIDQAVTLATVTVKAANNGKVLREQFEDRKRLSFGTILDSTAVMARPRLGELLEDLPLATVHWSRGDILLTVSDFRGGQCAPEIRIDGSLTTMNLAASVPTDRVAAVEWYPRSDAVPREFQTGGIRYRCGLLLIWTKWAFRIR